MFSQASAFVDSCVRYLMKKQQTSLIITGNSTKNPNTLIHVIIAVDVDMKVNIYQYMYGLNMARLSNDHLGPL